MPKKYPILFALGGVFGAILFMAVSFSLGWVVTSGRAHATAKETSEQAVIDQLVPICVHQFRSQPDSADKLDKLLGLDQWKREDFVREQGWSTMPGSDSSVHGVARECAARLAESAS